ncbi:hypothetical protein SAMD00019534_030560 [Acytostelium subglobosum LB1]|uniref:hypothetical protein n=1 Tax=Acytostelium subglobosum LB1 TaxID=1410327 RepID=UPI0006449620|nr:hypothetical protein SAMD00019534_030560 [Acytostelium subglobosum LB1]GAM19881.1 hypothetical protein SAMD00019534_030560 [Acytostelium subglobosum LB1]|eukprot:XP_012756643.1 hypothetical protein SAMD00019534_030560 [Acytostelium subglobosum LB1]
MKHDKNDSIMDIMFNIQYIKYEIIMGKHWMSIGNYGKALKTFQMVIRHYNDLTEEQFEYQSSIAKTMKLRTYHDLLKWLYNINTHKTYVLASIMIIKLCILLATSTPTPTLSKPKDDAVVMVQEESTETTSTPSKRSRKRKGIEEVVEYDADGNVTQVDDDPNGDKMLAAISTDTLALSMASTIMDKLLSCPSGAASIEVHLTACELYMEKIHSSIPEKYLLVLRSLLALKDHHGLAEKGHPLYHKNLVMMYCTVDKSTDIIQATRLVLENHRNVLLDKCTSLKDTAITLSYTSEVERIQFITAAVAELLLHV